MNSVHAVTTPSKGLVYASVPRAKKISGAAKAPAILETHTFDSIHEHHELWLPFLESAFKLDDTYQSLAWRSISMHLARLLYRLEKTPDIIHGESKATRLLQNPAPYGF